MKKWIKVTLIVSVAILAIAGVAFSQRSGKAEETNRTATVVRRDVVQDISFTGQLEAEQSVELGFEFPGTVRSLAVEIGSVVNAGQLLMRLDSQTAQLEQAKALADKASAQDQLYLAWQQTETALKNTKAENTRVLEERLQAVRNAKSELDQSKEVWLQKSEENGEDSSLTKTAYSSVVLGESAYKSAQDALATSQKTIASSNETSKAAAEAAKAKYLGSTQAASNNAGLSALEALERATAVKLAKSALISPINGVVTAINADVNEIVTGGTSIITVQTTDKLQLVSDVPETDTIDLSLAMAATITFDAIGSDEEWSAEVATIAPAAKVLDGIPTYEVTLRLNSTSERLRPGMTANIIVHAAQRQNVLAIPSRAIINRDNKKFVKVQTDDTTVTEKEIKTGLAGSDGWVEILSGLNEGEKIVTGPTES